MLVSCCRQNFLWIALALACSGSLAQAAETSESLSAPAESSPRSSAAVAPNPPPVSPPLVSMADAAPLLYGYFNNSHNVFGLPGTVVSDDFFVRSKVLNDWGGVRTDMAHNGVFVDVYSVSGLQNVERGLKSSSGFIQSVETAVSVDTGRAGFWSGGIFHAATETRVGSAVSHQMAAGTMTPSYTEYLDPIIERNGILPTEYYWYQNMSPQYSMIVGKLNTIYIADKTMFGQVAKDDFSAFPYSGANPVFTNTFSNTAWVLLGVYTPNEHFAVISGVADPNSKATNLAEHAFQGVNMYTQAFITYDISGLPGQIVPIFNWSSKKLTDLRNPVNNSAFLYSALMGQDAPPSNSAVPGASSVDQAASGSLAAMAANGSVINTTRNSWALMGNFSQYLYLVDDPKTVKEKMGSGQLVRGFGAFGRLGFGPPRQNFISSHASLGFYGAGLFDSRPYDRFGFAGYFSGLSGDFRHNYKLATHVDLGNEKGFEAFYTYAITPAVLLSSSYQYILDPTYAQIETRRKSSSVFLERLSVAW